MEGTAHTGLAIAVAICLVILIAQYVANVFDYVDPSAAF
jgi:hypothetical protein